MNKFILLTFFGMMVWTINGDIDDSNHCFAPCQMKSLGSGGGIRHTMGTIGDEELYDVGGIKVLPITNYHCVMKCANQLSQATMGPILQPGFKNEYNHECVLIENLDYCVQLWKVMNNVDCEVPIRTMVANTFGVSKRKRTVESSKLMFHFLLFFLRKMMNLV